MISHSGVRFSVPLLEDGKFILLITKRHFKNMYKPFKIFRYFTATSFVTLDVKYKDIVKLLIHFGKAMPVLFFYTTPSAAARIRELLGMQDPKGPYYDPAGKSIYAMNII